MLLSILSFAMGLQNAAVATSTGLLVRTTHLTGPATDLGIHLVELCFVKGEAHTRARIASTCVTAACSTGSSAIRSVRALLASSSSRARR